MTGESRSTSFIVALGNTRHQKIHCSAVAIGKKTILTSAHCLDGFKVSEIRFYLGPIVKFDTGAQEIKSFKIHEDFASDDDVVNDIAIIELHEELPANIAFPKLAAHGPVAGNFPVEANGYSRYTLDKSKTIFDYLFARTEDYDASEMYNERDEYGLHVKLLPARFQSPDIIVLEQQLGGICPGDSGGPTLMTVQNAPVLLGLNWSIVESPLGGNSCSREAAVLPVYKYLDWIRKNAVSEIAIFDVLPNREDIGRGEERRCIEHYLSFVKLFTEAHGEGASSLEIARQQICQKRQHLESVLKETLFNVKKTCVTFSASSYEQYIEQSQNLFPAICDLAQELD